MNSTPLFAVLLFVSTCVIHACDGVANKSPRICIIGGGITSATIAHFLTEKRLTPTPRITVFEKSQGVGGRIGTVNLSTKQGYIKVEAGASIIAEDNLLMQYFVDTLNLTRKSPADRSLGLWDGKAFIVRTMPDAGIRSKMVFVKRYGFSLVYMKRFVKELLASYKQVYPSQGVGSEWVGYESVPELFQHSHKLYNLSQVSFADIVSQQFNARFGSELVAAVTRVNYGQDPVQMNGLSGSVALAGSGNELWAVEGGNVQVVQGLFHRSGVEVLLNTAVENVVVGDLDGQKVYNLEAEGKEWTCDALVLAAPFELAGITLPAEIENMVDVGRVFHKTVATFVQGYLNTGTFGENPPESVLTTEGVDEPFTSVGMLWNDDDGGEPPIFKCFSSSKLGTDAMRKIFMGEAQILAEYSWMAYPDFSPPEKFAKFVSKAAGASFIYTSSLESAGSAVEMSAVSGANAAALLKKALGLKFEASHDLSEKEDL